MVKSNKLSKKYEKCKLILYKNVYMIIVDCKKGNSFMIQILMIEDDKHIAEGLKFLLEAEGYKVEIAATEEEGRRRYEAGKFQLVLLDVTLPDGDGFALFSWMQSKKEIPVIFLTALDEEKDIVKGLDLGADEYITKPFRPRELLSRIRNVIRRAGIEPAEKREIRIGNVCIDREEGTVYKNNERLEITALEYRLLLLFFENKGRILTRTQILANIWDESENYVNDNTLTVYIKRLREKIEENPNKPEIIKTVRGMGYQIGV